MNLFEQIQHQQLIENTLYEIVNIVNEERGISSEVRNKVNDIKHQLINAIKNCQSSPYNKDFITFKKGNFDTVIFDKPITINWEYYSFINEDFTLRTTYLTGGQLAVDVYSYVIGIVKALQEFKLDNNESPIIIDAPFAFTGTDQSEHLFKTLPTVSKQTILLTLDLNKIKNLLYDTDKYDFYVIKNETQEKAKIERGVISDIEF